MPTLDEILNEDFGVNGSQKQEKTASANNAAEETDEIEKLAKEAGLLDDSITTPAAETSQTKEAQAMSTMSDLYTNMFPEDTAEKVAADEGSTQEEKTAAAQEEALGALAHDEYVSQFDARMAKLAEAAISEGKEPPQQLPNNKKGGNASIDTTPSVDNEIKADNSAGTVGHEEQRDAAIKHAEAADPEAVALAKEMYDTGFSKLAADMADYQDKLASDAEKEKEEKKEEKKEHSEEEKKAAAELGAFIERGYFDGLRKLGSDRHQDEWHYIRPFIEEKVASGAAGKVGEFLSKAKGHVQMGGLKAHLAGKSMGGKAGAGLAAAGKAVTNHPGKAMAAGAAGAAAGAAGARHAFKKKDE